MLNSIVCKYEDFSEPWYIKQELNLKIREIYAGHSAKNHDFVNRKFWEWCVIAQALEERNLLFSGACGVGFAVGTEPLAPFFASRNCNVLATDLEASESNPGWIARNEHAASLDAIYKPVLLGREAFDARVSFKPVDMRQVEGISTGQDFLWSSCALEHLGTLELGIKFVLESAKLLRKGGVAVHTTEFNVSSNVKTVEVGDNVIYRRRDILALRDLLSQNGFTLSSPDFEVGDHLFDTDYDRPPYMESDRRHLKLLLDGYVSTSMLLIVERI